MKRIRRACLLVRARLVHLLLRWLVQKDISVAYNLVSEGNLLVAPPADVMAAGVKGGGLLVVEREDLAGMLSEIEDPLAPPKEPPRVMLSATDAGFGFPIDFMLAVAGDGRVMITTMREFMNERDPDWTPVGKG